MPHLSPLGKSLSCRLRSRLIFWRRAVLLIFFSDEGAPSPTQGDLSNTLSAKLRSHAHAQIDQGTCGLLQDYTKHCYRA